MKISNNNIRFLVHSAFRDNHGRKLIPFGLEWDMLGDSHVTYTAFTPPSKQNQQQQQWSPSDHRYDLSSQTIRRGIVEAHNRWCFAKSLPFVRVEDIDELSWKGQHIHVKWKMEKQRNIETEIRHQDIEKLLIDTAAAQDETQEVVEVWINGVFVSELSPKTLPNVLDALSETSSKKLTFKRSDGLIRIERYFRGMIRGIEVFEHLLDNLYALEDPEILDDSTLIGTATLEDWIMGGNLTSRLWLRELPNGNILCLRPLRNDDVTSADRRYELVKGDDDDKILLVRKELERLRFLASLPVPFQVSDAAGAAVTSESSEEYDHESERAKQHRRNRRKKFGL